MDEAHEITWHEPSRAWHGTWQELHKNKCKEKRLKGNIQAVPVLGLWGEIRGDGFSASFSAPVSKVGQ